MFTRRRPIYPLARPLGSDHPDDVFSRLLTFPNVIVTAHQGYFTAEALHEIATTTLTNVTEFEQGHPLANEIRFEPGADHVGGRRAA